MKKLLIPAAILDGALRAFLLLLMCEFAGSLFSPSIYMILFIAVLIAALSAGLYRCLCKLTGGKLGLFYLISLVSFFLGGQYFMPLFWPEPFIFPVPENIHGGRMFSPLTIWLFSLLFIGFHLIAYLYARLSPKASVQEDA